MKVEFFVQRKSSSAGGLLLLLICYEKRVWAGLCRTEKDCRWVMKRRELDLPVINQVRRKSRAVKLQS